MLAPGMITAEAAKAWGRANSLSHIHRAKAPSRRHFNVSVERTGYAAVGLTWVLEQSRDQETKDAAGKVNR